MPSVGGGGIGSKLANMLSASGRVLSGTQSQTAKNLSHIASTRGFLCASSIACCDFHSETSMMVPSFARIITGTRSVARPSFRNVGTRPRTSSRISASRPGFGRYATMQTIPAMATPTYNGAGCDSTKNFCGFVIRPSIKRRSCHGHERSENRRLHREVGGVRQTDPEPFAERRACRLSERRGNAEMVDAALRLQRHPVRNGGVQGALRVRLLEIGADIRSRQAG